MTFQLITFSVIGLIILILPTIITTDFTIKYDTTLHDKEVDSFSTAIFEKLVQIDPRSLAPTSELVDIFLYFVNDNNTLCTKTKKEMQSTTTLLGLLGVVIISRREKQHFNPEFVSNLPTILHTTPRELDLKKVAMLYNGKYSCNRTFKFKSLF